MSIKFLLGASACMAFLVSATPLFAQITTIAGTGPTGFMTGSYSGDGVPATSANLYNPCGGAFNAYGNFFFADVQNNRVRKIDNSGVITTVAGTGAYGPVGDGGPAIAAALSTPAAVRFDALGNLYIADQGDMRIRKVDASGVITTVAGTTYGGFSGDGGAATDAKFDNPDDVYFDPTGNMYICDWGNNRLRKVDAAGIVTTIAGNGSSVYSGDGGPATAAGLSVGGLLFDHLGGILVCDPVNHRIRKIDTAGVITTFAGNGAIGFGGLGGPATAASMYGPGSICYDYYGNIVFSDENGQRICLIDSAGILTKIAGNDTAGFSGDGGPATSAEFNYPASITFDTLGHLYISDLWNNRIRKMVYSDTVPALQVAYAAQASEIRVYPNPTSGTIHIANLSGTTTHYRLMGVDGNVVLQGAFHKPDEEISVPATASGTYFLVLQAANGQQYTTRVDVIR